MLFRFASPLRADLADVEADGQRASGLIPPFLTMSWGLHREGSAKLLPSTIILIMPAARGRAVAQVLLIQLLSCELRGIAVLSRAPAEAQGFFGILRVTVPAACRVAFDAGRIPSVFSSRRAAAALPPGATAADASAARARVQALTKIWETAGFREHFAEDVQNIMGAVGVRTGEERDLVLVYDEETFHKQKRQQRRAPSDGRSGGKRQRGSSD